MIYFELSECFVVEADMQDRDYELKCEHHANWLWRQAERLTLEVI
jgi:hypothetical protein